MPADRTMPPSRHEGEAVDIGDMLDHGVWSATQRLVVMIAALGIVFDGFDGQLIGYAIPLLIKQWGVTKGDFAPVVAMGLVGMAFGSMGAGYAGDRIGRRKAILASVLTFGIATSAIGLAQNIATIAVLRFVAGLGIGGALPIATTMAGEFTPQRHRTVAVTATIVCVPLGGMLAGVFASEILPVLGWQALFAIGGVLPILLSGVLFAFLPESARWMARDRARWPALIALLRRMGREVSDQSAFTDRAEQQAERRHAGLGALFAEGRGVSTVALWTTFFLTSLTVYLAFSWLPTMLTTLGLSVAVAGRGLTAYNLGGVFGAILCAFAINRFGSRWPLAISCLAAAGSAFYLRGLDAVSQTDLLILGIGVHGLFVNAVQATMYAVSGHLYPTSIRATGIAAGVAAGRMGAIVSAFAGAAVIEGGGALGYLALLAAAMGLACGALMMLRNHIPAVSGPSATAR